jgi:hypothetical protein
MIPKRKKDCSQYYDSKEEKRLLAGEEKFV